jgi:hypothetical protein
MSAMTEIRERWLLFRRSWTWGRVGSHLTEDELRAFNRQASRKQVGKALRQATPEQLTARMQAIEPGFVGLDASVRSERRALRKLILNREVP